MRSRILVYLNLIRWKTQIINITGFLVGHIFATYLSIIDYKFLLALVCGILTLSGIHALNQYTDAEIDIINRKARPIPLGLLTRNQVLAIVVTLYVLSLIIGLFVNIEFLTVEILAILIGILYSVKPIRLKDRFLLSYLSIALGYEFLTFLAGWSVYRSIIELLTTGYIMDTL